MQISEMKRFFLQFALPCTRAHIRGLTITEEFKIVLSLFVGYFAISLSKVLKSTRTCVERRIGAGRWEFIRKLTSVKYVISRSLDGFYFVIRPEWEDYYVTAPSFECEVKQMFKPKENEVVIDVGAHIGIYTARAAKSVGKHGLVIAIEPDPENFRLLKANMILNGLTNVVAYPLAADDRDGVAILYRSVESTHHSLVRVDLPLEEIKVQTVTLTTLSKRFNLDRVDWIKIDVEGAELNVLRGAEGALQTTRNLIVEVRYKNANQVFTVLEQAGFKTRVLVKYTQDMYILSQKHVDDCNDSLS